eukprot:CAMPEP_0119431000 /NCGR_PEP_ID=MMETSP1335-20130426/45111_1 /TAXON_ID=259385 /ORGANISM="Chrysoculter rhomboideus, Strain RCC1486" /LENGTH=142 /DNA_ID=CAMNT_0007456779 /DNA_START=42 /DNA_END=467 /DNA_ORIENTATION=-
MTDVHPSCACRRPQPSTQNGQGLRCAFLRQGRAVRDAGHHSANVMIGACSPSRTSADGDVRREGVLPIAWALADHVHSCVHRVCWLGWGGAACSSRLEAVYLVHLMSHLVASTHAATVDDDRRIVHAESARSETLAERADEG